MAVLFKMTARKDYRNGSIPWPEGMSGFWPQGETRLLPPQVREQVLRDGAGAFTETVEISYPAGTPDAEGQKGQPDGRSNAQAHGDEQDHADGAESPPAQAEAQANDAPDPVKAKRLAALEKARAARAAKKQARPLAGKEQTP